MIGIAHQFGKLIRARRLSRHISQDSLAGLAGLNRGYVGRIERGLASPSLETAHRLANALGECLPSLIAECMRDNHD